MSYRLLQNRESAQRFRAKRKTEFDVLREKVSELQTENSSLKSEVRPRQKSYGYPKSFLYLKFLEYVYNLRYVFRSKN